ncbi:MAG: OmpA family protein [Verrucomicrobiota bacterium]|nr:OmpA family protein [Verrucomicrobiota bacterium]
MKHSFFLALILIVLSLAGCKNLGKKGGGSYSGADGDYVSGTPLPERQEGVSFMSDNVDKKRFSSIHFGFDSYSIESSEEGKLEQIAEFLKSGSSSIIIAGFTDERGTPEYNRGLGERRAQSTRQWLISHGGDGGKLQTVSFGAEMPVDSGSSESAWAKNRRAEFGVVK